MYLIDVYHHVQNFVPDYVDELFETLTTTSREELHSLMEQLREEKPEPLHSMLKDKQSRAEAIEKHNLRKAKPTTICPPTCSGKSHISC